MSAVYVLLMRHGQRWIPGRKPGSGASAQDGTPVLSEDGVHQVTAVGRHLAATLNGLRDADESRYQVRLHQVWHAPSDEAKTTADVLCKELPLLEGQRLCKQEVHPSRGSAYRPSKFEPSVRTAADTICDGLKRALDTRDPFAAASTDTPAVACNALMVVGHQPDLGAIARQLTGESVPLQGAEVACLQGDHDGRSFAAKWRLLWTIGPPDEGAIAALHQKITAKMTVAGVLGGVNAAVLVFLLQSLADPPAGLAWHTVTLSWLAAAALFCSTWLYLAAVYFLDLLLMPVRFWGEATPSPLRHRPDWLIWRPPGSAAWVIYQNMTRVWARFFMPATYLVALGIGLVGLAVGRPDRSVDYLWYGLGAVLLVAALLAYSRAFRPSLGVED